MIKYTLIAILCYLPLCSGLTAQVDLINKNHSGLTKSKKILQDIKEIKIIEFDHKDVVRHPLVSKIIQAYQKNINDQN